MPSSKKTTKKPTQPKVAESEPDDKTKNPRIKYGDMVTVKVRCRFTKPFMGGLATRDEQDDPMNALYRDGDRFVIPARGLRAMLRDGSPFIDMSGTETTHVYTTDGTIDMNGSSVERLREIPILGRTGGRGFINSEIITTGAEFETSFAVPTKAISLTKFKELLTACGKWVGVGAYRKGDFGTFELLEFKPE